jgi:hypothetical protein
MIPTIETIARARVILENIESLQAELAGLFGGAAPSTPAPGRRGTRGAGAAASAAAAVAGPVKKRKMTAEGRARIAAAAKARWAKFREAKEKN